MKISSEKHVSLAYTLTIDGEIVERFDIESPMGFVYGVGMLPPAFEERLEGLSMDDTFEFMLTPDITYGERMAEAVVVLPMSTFEVNGEVDDAVIFEGNQLAMMDSEGNRRVGLIVKVAEEGVTMDFNHPFAGKTLSFVGSVVAVREATEQELNPSSCGCRGGGCSGGGCGDSSCGDGGCGCDDDDCEGGCCH